MLLIWHDARRPGRSPPSVEQGSLEKRHHQRGHFPSDNARARARGRARGQYPRSAVRAHPKLTSALPTVEPEMRHSIGTSPGVGIF